MSRKPKNREENEVGGLFEELFYGFLSKKYGLNEEDLVELSKKKSEKKKSEERKKNNASIPLKILNNTKLSSLEAIVKFLRENKGMSYFDIALLVSRNPRSLAVTYSVAKRKMPESFSVELDSDEHRVPFDAFSKDLSILESICVYLRGQNYTYSQIAVMLGKDPRTIWTVCNRADKKRAKHKEHGRN